MFNRVRARATPAASRNLTCTLVQPSMHTHIHSNPCAPPCFDWFLCLHSFKPFRDLCWYSAWSKAVPKPAGSGPDRMTGQWLQRIQHGIASSLFINRRRYDSTNCVLANMVNQCKDCIYSSVFAHSYWLICANNYCDFFAEVAATMRACAAARSASTNCDRMSPMVPDASQPSTAPLNTVTLHHTGADTTIGNQP